MFLLLFMIIASGVFGVDGDEVKSVSVMEGDSVTLHTDITDIQRDDHVVWLLESQGTLAVMHEYTVNTDDSNEIFRDRVELDNQTGSLTITNITITHIGFYKLQIFTSRSTLEKRFRVTVYAPLPVPVIISNSSQCSSSSERSSSSKCVLLCSVLNVRDVSLSWYKGNSLLSSISVSDLNIRLSLPLEVEYQDNNTYSCVVNNPLTNQTQHLNINDVCQQCPELPWLILSIVVSGLVAQLVAAVVIGVICYRYKKKKKIKEEKEAQAPPVDTRLPLIPDVDGNRSQIREDKDACYTPMKKTC